MENDELPKLPSLEEVLKSLGQGHGRRESEKESSFENRKYPIEMNCPILKRKTGEGAIEVLESSVVCEFFVQINKQSVANPDRHYTLQWCSIEKSVSPERGRVKMHHLGCPYYNQYSLKAKRGC